MKTLKRLAVLGAVLASTLVALPASAQFAKTEDAVKYRQNSKFVISQHFGRLGAMANGRAPFDAAAAAENAAVLEAMAKLPWAGFAAGTEGGKAKGEIWTEKAKFDELSVNFTTEAMKLSAAAKTGDLEKLKASFGAAAQTCKACHDAYRKR